MDFKPAELSGELVKQLQQFEHELQEQTSGNIVVIAYEYEPDGEQESQTKASK